MPRSATPKPNRGRDGLMENRSNHILVGGVVLALTIVTLGLFLLVITALMLWLASSLLPGFTIDTFFTAVYGALVLWVVGLLTNWIIKTE